MPTAEVCHRHGLSRGASYKCKPMYGGIKVPAATRKRSLEDKPAKLKRLLAGAMLDNVVPKDLPGTN